MKWYLYCFIHARSFPRTVFCSVLKKMSVRQALTSVMSISENGILKRDPAESSSCEGVGPRASELADTAASHSLS